MLFEGLLREGAACGMVLVGEVESGRLMVKGSGIEAVGSVQNIVVNVQNVFVEK